MKTYNKPAISKLVKRFDNELKDILTNDLKAFMANNQFIRNNKQVNMQPTLSVA